MVILNLDDIVIKNYGEQPVLVEGIEVCVLQDNSDDETTHSKTFEHVVSSRTTSAHIEAHDVTEFSVFHRIRVNEKIPADRWIERVRLRVEATRIGVKYYRFGEAFFKVKGGDTRESSPQIGKESSRQEGSRSVGLEEDIDEAEER